MRLAITWASGCRVQHSFQAAIAVQVEYCTQAAPDQRPMPTSVPASFPRNGRSPRPRLSSGTGVQRSATLLSTSIDRKPSILFCGHGILHDPQFGSGTPLNLMSASVKAPVGLSHYLEITILNKYFPCGSLPRKRLSEEHVQFTVAATTTPGRNTTTIP